MNDENQQKTVTGLCELWDGKAVTRVRATDASVVLYGQRLSLHLMVQPIIAERRVGESAACWSRDFLSRMPGLLAHVHDWHQDISGRSISPGTLVCRPTTSAMKTLLETKPTLAQGRQNELGPPRNAARA